MNESIFLYLNSFALQYEWLDQVIFFIAEYLGWVLIATLLTFLFTHTHTKKEGIKNILVVLSAAVLAWTLAHVFKYFYVSPRPFMALPDAHVIFENGSGLDSFPSGHATFFGALASAVFFYHRGLGVLYLFGALLIGVARVMAGVHWPFDVLAGWALGAFIGAFSYFLYHRVRRKER